MTILGFIRHLVARLRNTYKDGKGSQRILQIMNDCVGETELKPAGEDTFLVFCNGEVLGILELTPTGKIGLSLHYGCLPNLAIKTYFNLSRNFPLELYPMSAIVNTADKGWETAMSDKGVLH